MSNYWKTAIGRDGAPIPVPPEWNLPVRTQLAFAAKAVLGIALVIGFDGLAKALPTLFSEPAPPAEELLRRITWGVAVAFGTGILCVVFGVGVAALFWPFSRRNLGQALEDAIDARSLVELDREIGKCREQVQTLSGTRRKHLEARLKWLTEKREARLVSEENYTPQ